MLIHIGRAPFLVLGAPFEPVLRRAAVPLVFWTILFWMYRRKIFLRIWPAGSSSESRPQAGQPFRAALCPAP